MPPPNRLRKSERPIGLGLKIISESNDTWRDMDTSTYFKNIKEEKYKKDWSQKYNFPGDEFMIFPYFLKRLINPL